MTQLWPKMWEGKSVTISGKGFLIFKKTQKEGDSSLLLLHMVLSGGNSSMYGSHFMTMWRDTLGKPES